MTYRRPYHKLTRTRRSTPAHNRLRSYNARHEIVTKLHRILKKISAETGAYNPERAVRVPIPSDTQAEDFRIYILNYMRHHKVEVVSKLERESRELVVWLRADQVKPEIPDVELTRVPISVPKRRSKVTASASTPRLAPAPLWPLAQADDDPDPEPDIVH